MNSTLARSTAILPVMLSKSCNRAIFAGSSVILSQTRSIKNVGKRSFMTKDAKALEELNTALEAKKTDKLYKNFHIHINDLPSQGLRYKRMNLLLTPPNRVNHASLIFYLQGLSDKEHVLESFVIMKRCLIKKIHFDDSIMNLFISKCLQYDCFDECVRFLKEETIENIEMKPYLFAKLIANTKGEYASAISRRMYNSKYNNGIEIYTLMSTKYHIKPSSRVCNQLLQQLINAKDYPNIIRYYSLFDPQTIHISQSVFEQILPLVPEENKADRQLIQSGLDKCIQYKQKQTIPK